jgi:SAM-dependent methyltransferase
VWDTTISPRGCREEKLRVSEPRFDAAEIGRYYDLHTPAFLRFGQGGGAGVIHRAVWGPGTTTREQAFHYVDDRVADMVRSLMAGSETPDTPHVVDLGCGVGASLSYLAKRLPIWGTGITLSPIQARLAAERVRDAGLARRVTCIEADYCDLPHSVEPADLAYAIESFVHGPAPDRFFAECRRLIRPSGLLVICDDVRRSAIGEAAARAIDRFCRGWRINTLLCQDELQTRARTAGFEHESTIDLTSALETGRARDRAIALLGAVCGRLSIGTGRIDHLLGGAALQECLAHGWIGYDLSVFRRTG